MSRPKKQDYSLDEFKRRMKDPDFGVPDPIDEDDTELFTLEEFKAEHFNPGDFE